MAKEQTELKESLIKKLKTIQFNLSLCKNRTDFDNLTVGSLCMIQGFLHHSIQLFADRFRTQITLQKGYRDEFQNLILSKETEIIPETALSSHSAQGANVTLLRNLTQQFELFETVKHIQQTEIIESQQKLLWEIIQHISKLIAKSQIKP